MDASRRGRVRGRGSGIAGARPAIPGHSQLSPSGAGVGAFGDGVPSPNPNTTLPSGPLIRPIASGPTLSAATSSSAISSASSINGPSFTNGISCALVTSQVLIKYPLVLFLDILNRLNEPKRTEMMTLVQRFKTRQIGIQDFLSLAQTLLGEQLFAVLSQGMSSASKPLSAIPPISGMSSSAANVAPYLPPGFARPVAAGVAQPVPNNPLPAPKSNVNPIVAATAATEETEVDVNKLDSSALQDVMQYSGVDLKAESEAIYRHHENHGYIQSGHIGKDPRMAYDHLLNSMRLKALIQSAVSLKGITEVSEDCLELISQAVRQRIASAMVQLSKISNHRVGQGRSRFKIKIENDPKKQIWLLDQFAIQENERVKAGQGSLTTSEAMAARAKQKKVEKRIGEDVAVKTKLANVTAAAATGLQLKSWMTDATISSHDISSPTYDGSSAPADEGSPHQNVIHFSQAPSMTSLTDKELQNQYAHRTINLKDLIFFTENDPHLRRTPLLLSLYNHTPPNQ